MRSHGAPAHPTVATDDARRHEMVQLHLAGRDIRDPLVLRAMGEVARERFLPDSLAEFAYDDTPLPIEAGQTISQPYIVALMAQALELAGGDRVLEIGTGSGYAAAVLSRIAGEVYSVERHGVLARLARERCRDLGYDNVHVLEGDGSLGWAEHAPYDAIVVAAGGPDVPPALLAQLGDGGRLVMPVGSDPWSQELIEVVRRPGGAFTRRTLGAVRFVPLVGAGGWASEDRTRAEAPHAAPTEDALDDDHPSTRHGLGASLADST